MHKNSIVRGYYFADAMLAIRGMLDATNTRQAEAAQVLNIAGGTFSSYLNGTITQTPARASFSDANRIASAGNFSTKSSLAKFSEQHLLKLARYFGRKLGHPEGFVSVAAMIQAAQQLPVPPMAAGDAAPHWARTDYLSQAEEIRLREETSLYPHYKRACQMLWKEHLTGKKTSLTAVMSAHGMQSADQKIATHILHETYITASVERRLETLQAFAPALGAAIGLPDATLPDLLAEARRRAPEAFPPDEQYGKTGGRSAAG